MAGKHIYSARGDDGKTSLMGAGRYPKSDFRFEVLGSIDEASAAIGFAKACLSEAEWKHMLTQIQRDLYLMMGEISTDPLKDSVPTYVFEDRIKWLEDQISKLSDQFDSPGGFIIPGDSKEDAALDVARSIIRRAERRLVSLIEEGGYHNEVARQYLNRLSSLVFCLEIVIHSVTGDHSPTLAKQA